MTLLSNGAHYSNILKCKLVSFCISVFLVSFFRETSSVSIPDGGQLVSWFDCRSLPDGSYKHDETCDKYIVCLNKKYAYEVQCDEIGGTQLIFDEEEGSCEDPSVVQCDIEEVESDAYPAIMIANYQTLSR